MELQLGVKYVHIKFLLFLYPRELSSQNDDFFGKNVSLLV